MKEKQKIIFLDIDGVLNGYNFWNTLGWDIICFLHLGEKCKGWYRKLTKPSGVHKSKVKRLAKLVKITGAKVVMSSTWRISFWRYLVSRETCSENIKILAKLFKDYDIEVVDITPYSLSTTDRREREIKLWLSTNMDKVESFVVLDDEKFDLQSFVGTRLVQTKKGKGRFTYLGLTNKNIKTAMSILDNKIMEDETKC